MVSQRVAKMKQIIKFIKGISKSIISNRSGITLVEVIVSIALIGIVVTLISNMFMTAFTIIVMNMPKTKNSLNVGGTVATASVAAGQAATSGGVTVSAGSGTATVDFGSGNISQVAGTYESGATDASTSSEYAASAWAFSPGSR